MLVAQTEKTLKLAIICRLEKLGEAPPTLELLKVVHKGETGVRRPTLKINDEIIGTWE